MTDRHFYIPNDGTIDTKKVEGEAYEISQDTRFGMPPYVMIHRHSYDAPCPFKQIDLKDVNPESELNLHRLLLPKTTTGEEENDRSSV